MGTIFQINKKRTLSLDQARALLPIIRRITDESSQEVKKVMTVLDAVRAKDKERAQELEEKINGIVTSWQNKVEKLGAEGKGLWLVDFDCGSGYYCWKYPELELDHFHSYTEGFQARVKIDENITKVIDENPN